MCVGKGVVRVSDDDGTLVCLRFVNLYRSIFFHVGFIRGGADYFSVLEREEGRFYLFAFLWKQFFSFLYSSIRDSVL